MKNRNFSRVAIMLTILMTLAFCGCLYERQVARPTMPTVRQRISIDNLFGQDLQYQIACKGHGGCTTFAKVSSGVPHLTWIRMYRRGGEILFYNATTDELSCLEEVRRIATEISAFISQCEIDGVDVSVVRDEYRLIVGVEVSEGTGRFIGEHGGRIKPGVL